MMATVDTLSSQDVLLAHGKREFGSRVVEVVPATVGMKLAGPRGGAYRLTAEGVRKYVVVVLANGQRPLLPKGATVTVSRDGEE